MDIKFENRKVMLTETILRDAHQSQAATRMRIEEMLPVLEQLDEIGYYSIEAWGGATFDSCLRFLNEDPWERLRTLKSHLKTPIQMLLRGQNLLGYRHYADDVVEKFVAKSIENGVGVIALQRQQFMDAMEEFDADEKERNLTVATGVAAAPFIQKLVDEARKKWHNLNCKVIAVENRFFGENITVAGLITGKDLIEQVKGEAVGDRILIPTEMLRYQGDLFLDDVSLEEAEEALGRPLMPVEADGYEVLRNLLGEDC